MASSVRIGIDVGGTFTHAVALDGLTLEILAKSKVPTTHRASQGVALGIIEALQALLAKAGIQPESVNFIAHSTTQATNALLEGDVAPVGILGMGSGASAWLARSSTNIKNLKLAPGKYLTTYHQFLDSSDKLTDDAIQNALHKLITAGAKAIAISEAFAVDVPLQEMRCLQIAQNMGLVATCGSQVSQLYGLKVRTRTAVINASMLPKMIESANMTESSVRQAGIKAPVMIMRSDGGVMDIDAMRQKPILTMLSGPAAGVAAAMMYLHISDGIFLEVGGTSTDISAIRNGKALVKSAEVGGHRVYMQTLDVRTVGVAGGSLPRLKDNQIIDVGPRSAHIAGLGYASFTSNLDNPQITLVRPQPADPDDYIKISEDSTAVALTPTCAANLLSLVPDADCASGNLTSITKAFTALSQKTSQPIQDLAKKILTLAADKCSPIVKQLMKDYKLDESLVTLVGGGGGAAAIVPYLGQDMNLRHSLAQNADVISAIGVALALVRETIERQIIHPTNDDILRIRQQAHDAVHKMGANPDSIEVHVEVDNRTNIVRATATGATSLTGAQVSKRELSNDERRSLAAESMRCLPERVKLAAKTAHYQVYTSEFVEQVMAGLFQHKCQALRVVDKNGVIRLQMKNGAVQESTCNNVDSLISQLCEQHAQYGDAGKIIPNIMLLAGPKIIDLSGLPDIGQVVSLAKIELESLPSDAPVIVLASLS